MDDRKYVDGPKLADLRRAAGLTQVQLGVAAGVDPSVLSKIERSIHRNPAISTVQAFARVLGVTVDELLLPAPEEVEASA